jgi:hypothetical protein
MGGRFRIIGGGRAPPAPASISLQQERRMDPSVSTAPDEVVQGVPELPPELQGPAPREIPDAVKQSRLATRQKAIVWGLVMGGLFCVGIDGLPFIETLSLYILPLAYLLWIGIGLCAMAAVAQLHPGELKKARRYLAMGETGFGRVKALVKTPTLVSHGRPTTYAIVATVSMPDPATGQLCERQMKSRSFGAAQKDRVSTPFRVGDLVPVVWLPGQFEKTAQLYDFLEVMPGRSLIYRTGTTPLWLTLLILSLIPIFFLALLWNIYGFEKYQPVDFDWMKQGWLPISVGGSLALAALMWGALKQRGRVARQNAQAVQTGDAVELTLRKGKISLGFGALVLAFGSVLLGGATAMSCCLTVNALLDKSPPVLVPVQITHMVQITHEGIFREYKLQFRRANDKEDLELLTTPQHLAKFNLPIGIAHIRSGWFGWHWIQTVEPIQLGKKPAGGA